ncbi:MAG: cytidylyltransferase domain-containing protein [Flavobacterium sp.]
MNKSIAFFIQARTGSSRLPNKVLLSFDNENCILGILIQQLQTHFKQIPLVVCTSTAANDDVIVSFCESLNVTCFRGSENNVLERFIDAAKHFETKVVVRICADNPFLDMGFIAELLDFYTENPSADYWSFKNATDVPAIKTHFGFFAEIVTLDALKKVSQLTDDPLYTEHVTNFVYSNAEFNSQLKVMPDFLKHRNDLRFTIDDATDFELLKEVFQFHKENKYNIEKTILWVEKNPLLLNNMVANIKKYSK